MSGAHSAFLGELLKFLRATTTILVIKKRPSLSLRKNHRLDEFARSARGRRNVTFIGLQWRAQR
jgi:hypothetical protein